MTNTAAHRDDVAALDVTPARNTPRVLGSPQGHELGDIVAVDGGIIEWLARREAVLVVQHQRDDAAPHSSPATRKSQTADPRRCE
jgi:hypothetical protein